MDKLAKRPFEFHTAYYLSLYTGVKAWSLEELVEGIKRVDGGAIFHHVFHAVRKKHLLLPLYNNDFARWIHEELGDEDLAVEMSEISGAEPATVEDVRKELLSVLEGRGGWRRARSPFIFVSMRPVTIPTGFVAKTLGEFIDGLQTVAGESIFYHFVAKRAFEGGVNDFSKWLLENFGLVEIAEDLSRIDPLMFQNEEGLREAILKVVRRLL